MRKYSKSGSKNFSRFLTKMERTSVDNLESCVISPDVLNQEVVFITGCSGFLGKVILEKLLRSFKCRRIYVLLRSKKVKDVSQRFESDILGSKIFGRLRDSKGPQFEPWIRSLVKPISGDLLSAGMGLSIADREMLANEVSVIIHSAASVEFDLPLEQATQINTDGSLEVLRLGKECVNLKSYVHISTCYVNGNQFGTIAEKIYDCPYDPREMYEYIKTSSSQTLAENKDRILNGWPNTYTFTKFLTEHLILQQKDNVPVLICRPSIIAAGLHEPYPGWLDNISAASAVFFASGLGLIRSIPGSVWNVADLIPVDLCANMIICGVISQVLSVLPPTNSIPIMHCGTSSSAEPMPWLAAEDVVPEYFRTHPIKNRLRSPHTVFIAKGIQYDLNRFIHNTVPAYLVNLAYSLTENKNFRKMLKGFQAGDKVSDAFAHFTTNEWVFQSDLVRLLYKPEMDSDRILFLDALDNIDWYQYLTLVCYGMRKYCLNDAQAELPRYSGLSGDVLTKRKREGIVMQNQQLSDWSWSQSHVPMEYEVARRKEIFDQVLNHPDVVACARDDQKKVGEIFYSIATNFDHNNTRFFALTLQKAFSKMYDRISINEDQLSRVKELVNGSDGPVVLLPTHRSYIDFLLLSYVMFSYHMKVPFVAAGEDFQKIPGINSFLRKSGAFFMKRKFDPKTDPLYVAVFKAYMQSILTSHGVLEFFIEGTRSRSGKTLKNKNGLLSFALDLFFDKKVPNIHLVPVSISYEHVLEDDSFFKELLGSSKTPESLSRIAKAASVVTNKYGRVDVIFGEPISVRETVGSAERNIQTVNMVGEKVAKQLSENLCVMPTHLIACIFVLNKFKPISFADLVSQFETLRDDLQSSQNVRLDVPSNGTCERTVATTLESHFKDRCVRDQRNVRLIDDKGALCMSYYKNQLVSILGPEAVVLVSVLVGSGSLEEIKARVKFVAPIVGVLVSEPDVKNILQERLVPMKLVCAKNGVYSVDNQAEQRRLRFFHKLIEAQLDTALVLAKYILEQKGNKSRDLMSCWKLVQKFATEQYRQGKVVDPEVCSTEAIKTALFGFVKVNILAKDCRVIAPDFTRVIAKIEKYRYARLDEKSDQFVSLQDDSAHVGLGNNRTARL